MAAVYIMLKGQWPLWSETLHMYACPPCLFSYDLLVMWFFLHLTRSRLGFHKVTRNFVVEAVIFV